MNLEAISDAARLLVEARRTGARIPSLPESCSPHSIDDAHAIQDATVAALGDAVAGWKVTKAADGQVVRGVILRSRVLDSPAHLPASTVPLLGVEAEVAFRFERALPPRVSEYSYEDVAAAVVALPAIEIVDTRFQSYSDAPLMQRFADFVSNGAFVPGHVNARWRAVDLAALEVTLAFDGNMIERRVGGHPTGDPLLPAVALVNHMRTRGGVDAGKFMTTGTYTRLTFAQPGQTVTATFTGFGGAQVHFDK